MDTTPETPTTRADTAPTAPAWKPLPGLSPYGPTIDAMEAAVDALKVGAGREEIWLVEHDHVITLGTSTRDDPIAPADMTIAKTRRGGQATYHGPGQRVVYPILDLRRRGKDVRAYITRLETWIIAALAEFAIEGFTRPDRVGVWVARPDKGLDHEDKIAAIGVRISRWIAFHGAAVNVAPDLTRFEAFTPCGISDPRYGVTSIQDLAASGLARDADLAALDQALRDNVSRLLAA